LVLKKKKKKKKNATLHRKLPGSSIMWRDVKQSNLNELLSEE